MASFLSLPEEILIQIMMNLDRLSLVRCTATCRHLCCTYKNSAMLQYMLELDVNEMKDAGTETSLPERLARIRDLRINWTNGNWKDYKDISFEVNDHRSHDFVAGVLAISEGASLKVIWLPSSRTAGRTIEHQSPETPFEIFTLDPTQNLLVFLETEHGSVSSVNTTRLGRVHLRMLSTNEIHPEAQQPILTFQLPADSEGHRIIREASLHLASEILAAFVVPWRFPPRLLIWNWNNGSLIYDSGDEFGFDIQDFALLDRTSFLLTSRRDSGRILLYKISTSSFLLDAPLCVAVFYLPPLKPRKYVEGFLVDLGAFQDRASEGSLFFSTPDSRIIVFSITYAGLDVPHDSGKSFQLCVHSRSLLEYLPRFLADSELKGNDPETCVPLEVLWEDWGENNTRFLSLTIPMRWSRFVHGNRIARITPSQFQAYVDILDFNITRSLMPNNSRSPAGEHYLCRVPYCIPAEIFESEVITRLPYRTVTIEFAALSPSYLIDDERFVAVKIDSHNNFLIDGLEAQWF